MTYVYLTPSLNTYISKKQGVQSLGLYKDCGPEKGIYRVKNRTNF